MQLPVPFRQRWAWMSVPWVVLLAALGIGVLLFVGSRVIPGKGGPRGSAAFLQAQTPPGPAALTNDVLVIPVKDKTGKEVEPMVLVPVNGGTPIRTALTNEVAAVPASLPTTSSTSTNVGIGELPGFEEKFLILQVALARRAISSGS